MMRHNFSCSNSQKFSNAIVLKAHRYDRLKRELLMTALLILPYWVISL